MKVSYFNNLPHHQPVGATFFITFRLFGSIPAHVLNELKAEKDKRIRKLKRTKDRYSGQLENEAKRYFAAFDNYMDKNSSGPHWLRDSNVAKIVTDKIHSFEKSYYDLIAYCIMSNHVHLLIDTANQLEELNEDQIDDSYTQVYDFLKLLKGASAHEANQLIGRKGSFWEKGSYDHIVKNEKELRNIIDYILQNPVKAGLTDEWQNWPHSYVNDRYL